MAERSLSQQLDEALDLLLANAQAPSRDANPRIAPLLEMAAQLRDLPSAAFRERLRSELEREKPMTAISAEATTPVQQIRHTITPYLAVPQAAELIDFVKRAFHAQEIYRGIGSQGGLHAEVKIGDSTIMIGGGEAFRGAGMPTNLHLYVKDADAVYRRAVEAGATSTHQPVDQPYGDREAGVRDLAGNAWYIATHQATGLAPQGLRTVTPYLHPRGAGELIGFLERAFGAKEIDRFVAPDGTIAHAMVRIGDSILEMGEAHGPYQPMPTMFYLSVDDVDASYRRAVEAGAVALAAPADQPYGDRVGSVKDPSENLWYLATPIKH